MAIRTNLCMHPSFETDANADGISDGWARTYTTFSAPTCTRPAALLGMGSFAQRMAYTGVAGDAAGDKAASLYNAGGGVVGSFAPGESCTASVFLRGAAAGCTPLLVIKARNAAGGGVNEVNVGITPTEEPNRYERTYANLPAGTSFCYVFLTIGGIGTDNTFDITMDGMQVEKAAAASAYFDGSYSFCHWTGPANASISIHSGLTVAPTRLLRPTFLPQGRVT